MKEWAVNFGMELAGPACVFLFLAMVGLAVRAVFWMFPL